jgi:hypothetical protein
VSEIAVGGIKEFRILGSVISETVTTPEITDRTQTNTKHVEITPDMETGVLEYANNYQKPYTGQQRAIAISALKHSFFLPAGRHRRPRH